MPKLKSEIKLKWVNALRSGKYDQGKGRLKDDENKFCCLGVLCDVINPGSWKLCPIVGWKHGDIDVGAIHSDEFADLFEADNALEAVHQKTDINLIQDRLIKMNDDEGKSFEEIADYVEENL